MKAIILTLICFSSLSFASGRHYKDGMDGKDGKDGSGTALGLAASQHQFDWNTMQYQGSLAVGAYNGESAVSLGLAKRLCPNCGKALLSGSVGAEKGKIGGGVGIGFRW